MTEPQHQVLLAGLGLLGLVVGSFLNVVVHRLPRMILSSETNGAPPGYGLVRPGSACLHCGRPLRWRENVPIASFLLLRGRCAGCGGRIPARYPLVEALGAVLPLMLATVTRDPSVLAAGCVFLWCSIALAAIDLEHLLLPDAILLVLLAAGLAANLGAALFATPAEAVLGLLGGYAALKAVQAAATRVLGRPSLGDGDIKLFGVLGAWFGPWLLPTLLAAAAGAATLAVLALIATGRMSRQDPVPFGPFLLAAGGALLLIGAAGR